MKFADKVMQMAANGIARFTREVGAELKQKAEHGATEIFKGLHEGDPFVLYGRGQIAHSPENAVAAPEHDVEHQQHHGLEV